MAFPKAAGRPLSSFLLKQWYARWRNSTFMVSSEVPMNLSVSTRVVDGVVIVDIFGQLRLGEATSKLRDVVQGLLTEGYKKLLLNMAEVHHIDSSGIGELMTTYTAVKNQGGELKLLNLHKNVRNLLQVTRLYTIFDVQEDLVAAIKTFQ
jgi:anti-sigma B factor antagonist